ncbi:MAG: DUF1598 domain-containing protein [Pirellulales bacterium]
MALYFSRVRRTDRIVGRGIVALFLGGFIAVAFVRPVVGAEPDAAAETSLATFRQQLAAGEFAPALLAAQQLQDTGARDARLAELAEAQSAAGDRRAAYSTLLHVEDDRVRNEAVKSARQRPPTSGDAGGAQADFDTLIELITTTVKPDTWDDVGGPGSVSEFPNGVYVDASGELHRVLQPRESKQLAIARLEALTADKNTDSNRASPLRKISLNRLEKYVQLRLAAGRRPTEEMLHLAGLEKIDYVFVYPDTGDLVLAGPACDWRIDQEGRAVSRATGRPVLQLDDLVVVLRHLTSTPDATFGCSIDPTPEGLARTKRFAEQSAATPLKPAARGAWLKKLRHQMGRQAITVNGIDPRTRVARVLVEADYRMKLIGMGIEEGTVDVPSYLDLIHVAAGQAPPPLDVLRWWFALKYDAVVATEPRDAFEIRGPGVQVLSENELLTALGRRVHTGASEALNSEFAHRFTTHFAALAQKYPVYADLQNVFDLALVASLIQSQQLAERVNWHMLCFSDPEQYGVALGQAPQSVETVINHRVINGRHIVAGVSGGVSVSPWQFTSAESIKPDDYGALRAHRAQAQAQADKLPLEAWWWD